MLLKHRLVALLVPSGLVITPMVSQVGATWNAVTGASYYNIYYQTGSTVDKNTASKASSLLPTTIITGLTNNVQYAFAVSVVISGRESPLSSVVLGTPIQTYSQRIIAANPSLYWPLSDSVGTTAAESIANFTIAYGGGTGVTYGTTGIGDGLTAVTFNGIDTYIQIGKVGFTATYWDGNTGSALLWAKIDNLARWDDVSTHRWLFHIRAPSDGTYYLTFGKSNASAKLLSWRRRTGGLIAEVLVSNFTSTDWFCMGMTWSLTGGIRAFLNGAYVGTSSLGITDWLGKDVDGGTSILYAGSNTLQEWFGSGARCAYWKGVALSDATMIALTTL